MRVIICDDHAMMRDGIRLMLSLEPQCEVVAETADGRELLTRLEQVTADVIVLDLQMGEVGGLTVLEALAERKAAPPVVVLTMHDDPAFLRRAVELGARGYVLKRSGREELSRALHAVMAGGAYVDPHLTASLVNLATDHSEQAKLEGEATRLLRFLADGLDVSQIAQATGHSEGSIRSQTRSLYRALGVKRRSDAVAVALRRRLIE